ncbi:hypothetical protein SAMN05880590_107212 [Rhizobium sp. RU35A]|uniref:hypothetical protein n=1 Tax=Rhizobium sp. RU35A TaxID=1907414 RepID=UPI00095557E2|nr:hypothetical protein [Rhizobium sp. RU35A]SIQ79445.1 hypothetical protein SAMN05880590_107212 [Rhizobium sp. RU35A]
MSVIPFSLRRRTEPDLRAGPEDRLLVTGPPVQPSEVSEEDALDTESDHHWGVAMALASWPLCLGASAVLAVI